MLAEAVISVDVCPLFAFSDLTSHLEDTGTGCADASPSLAFSDLTCHPDYTGIGVFCLYCPA